MLRNKLLVFGLLIVLLLAVCAFFAPYLSAYDFSQIDVDSILMPPSSEHILGTDSLGRDLFSRMLFGSRVSLKVGFIAVGISTIIGCTVGSIAGFYGKWIDSVIMRFVDLMLCFPTFFLILSVVAILEPSITNIMIIIGLTSWMGVARIVRAQVLSLKEREFIQAAHVIGASNMRIILKHLLPNAFGPVVVAAILGMAYAILVESSLSFLGIGVQPPTPSWGNILIEAKSTLGVAWWLTLFPGLAIFITILGYNMLGEGLRNWQKQ
ncbi:MAG: ABC transporter permease [Candidatus Omnitrophica bacterium]|nr:ABC transporter permease [Candidatus Omnitrophota bacterium]